MVSNNSDARDGDYADSLIVKMSGFAQGTSDDDAKGFLSGVEIDVRIIHKQIFLVSNLSLTNC
jgi:hypothetical protein